MTEEEEEWNRRRRMMDEDTGSAEADRESVEVMREARALDKAMEDRIVARKTSASSVGSSAGIGMGSAWKSRYGHRKRTGSIASIVTSGSILSEDLVEESEEQELLGVGGGFDCPSVSFRSYSGETTEEDTNASSPDAKNEQTMNSFRLGTSHPASSEAKVQTVSIAAPLPQLDGPPPSAPASKTSFGFASRLAFKRRSKKASLDVLPTVPSSPVISIAPEESAAVATEPRRRVPPPLSLGNSRQRPAHGRSSSRSSQMTLNTPAQTLFVFPPSPTLKAQAPLTVTVTSSLSVPTAMHATPTPRVSTFKLEGRRRSFIGLATPPTPTTASSRVDARGWVGLGAR